MEDGKYVPGSIWFYAPNKAAPIFFGVAFLITTVWHFWQCFRYKAWKVTGLHPVTCCLFVGGFACRAYGAWAPGNVNIYIASTALIYFSPPLLELANYHALGRILFYVPYKAPLNPARTLTTFGILSTVIEILNGLGVSWMANPALGEKFIKTGHGLLQAGLILQIVIILAFCCTAGVFHRRCANAHVLTRKTRGPLVSMYISSFLILIRCVYRTVEYFTTSPTSSKRAHSGGVTMEQLNHENPIIRYEWYFYVFEATVLLLNEFLWNVRHPRHYLPQDYHIYLAQDGVTELEGPGSNDKRPLALTFLDPFGWLDACAPSKNPKEVPYWEKNGFGKMGQTQSPESPSSISPIPSRVASSSRGAQGGGAHYTTNNTSPQPHVANRNHHLADPTARTDHRNIFIILMDPLGWVWKKK